MELQTATDPLGMPLTPDELLDLAGHLDQVIECELRGFLPTARIHSDADASLVIRALDSTEWTLQIMSDAADG